MLKFVLAFGVLGSVVAWGVVATPVGQSTERVAQCKTWICVYQELTKKEQTAITENDCKPLAAVKIKESSVENLDELCRVYRARRAAASRVQNRCDLSSATTSDIDRALPEHALWIYTDLAFRALPVEQRQGANLAADRFSLRDDYRLLSFTRYATFNESYTVKVKKRKRERELQKKRERALAYNVYYCISAQGKLRQYVPYYWTLRLEPVTLAEGEVPSSQSPVAMSSGVMADLPAQARALVAQLPQAQMQNRYAHYELVDFNKDGHVDLVFLQDEFKNYRPGMCLYRLNQDTCELVLPTGFSKSALMLRKPHLLVEPSTGIEVVVVDQQYKNNQEHFHYVFRNGKLAIK